MKRHGFTLIELLVVVAIIVALLAILLPSLGKAIGAAESAVCASNTRQWSTMNLQYCADNFASFLPPDDGNPGTDWMYRLRNYTDDDQTRTCPTASEAGGPVFGVIGGTGQYGGTSWRWDLDFGTDEEHAYGSYGINSWLHSVGASGHIWRGESTRPWHYQKMTAVKRSAATPTFADSSWINSNPFDIDSGQLMGQVPPSATWNEENASSPLWLWDMGRYVMRRHHGGINMAFVDGSSRRIDLSELWGMAWHREFRATSLNLYY